ncbi:MAG: hypothetical protein RLZ14_1453 [Actinomycetota bacterium]|jgi:DNA polymerase-3 subunit epsilon
MTSPVGTQRFTVVDVETSGLDVRRHRVLQVGLVTVDGNGDVLARWSTLVAPRRRLFFRVGPSSLHGIRRRHLRHAPPLESVMQQLAARLRGTQFVAHNAPFDLAFLRQAAAEAHVELPIAQPLCTLRLSRALDPGRTMSHRLGDLCVRYGVSLDRPHDALADAEATAAILPHLLKAHGVVTVDQLAALPAAS